MGLALLAIIWLITFLSTYFFVAKTWWLPVGASAAAPWIDHQLALTYVLMGIVFVAAQGSPGAFGWPIRERGSATALAFSNGNSALETLLALLSPSLCIGLTFMVS